MFKLPLLIYTDIPFEGPWVLLEKGSWIFDVHENVIIKDESNSLLQTNLTLTSPIRVRATLKSKLTSPITINATRQ